MRKFPETLTLRVRESRLAERDGYSAAARPRRQSGHQLPGEDSRPTSAWTFQTLDKNGMVLNMAQTWHQVRPGEIRNDCGGCHAHSQKPTLFENTAAARPDYPSST